MEINSNIDLRDAFFYGVKQIMQTDSNAVVLTADHGAFILGEIEKEFPDRYFNVGISEQNMINMASGMALKGKSVYTYSINNFLILRALEQININICAMNLNVNLIGTGAGFTYSTDGFTHHGIQDLGIAMSLPNLSIYNVTDAMNSYYLANTISALSGPKYFRIEKGKVPQIYTNNSDFSKGFEIFNHHPENDILLISTGFLSHSVKEIALELSKDSKQISYMDIFKVKPFDELTFLNSIDNINKIVMIEENFYLSSFGKYLTSILKRHKKKVDFLHIAIDEEVNFYYGSRDSVLTKHQLDNNSIMNRIKKYFNLT